MSKFQLGYVEGETRQELGLNSVKHCGLFLENDDMVGKTVQFKNAKFPAYKGLFEVICRQRVWGYDKDGCYTMINGYRVSSLEREDNFGLPTTPYEIEVV